MIYLFRPSLPHPSIDIKWLGLLILYVARAIAIFRERNIRSKCCDCQFHHDIVKAIETKAPKTAFPRVCIRSFRLVDLTVRGKRLVFFPHSTLLSGVPWRFTKGHDSFVFISLPVYCVYIHIYKYIYNRKINVYKNYKDYIRWRWRHQVKWYIFQPNIFLFSRENVRIKFLEASSTNMIFLFNYYFEKFIKLCELSEDNFVTESV